MTRFYQNSCTIKTTKNDPNPCVRLIYVQFNVICEYNRIKSHSSIDWFSNYSNKFQNGLKSIGQWPIWRWCGLNFNNVCTIDDLLSLKTSSKYGETNLVCDRNEAVLWLLFPSPLFIPWYFHWTVQYVYTRNFDASYSISVQVLDYTDWIFASSTAVICSLSHTHSHRNRYSPRLMHKWNEKRQSCSVVCVCVCVYNSIPPN